MEEHRVPYDRTGRIIIVIIAYHDRGGGYQRQDQQASGGPVGTVDPSFHVARLLVDPELGRFDGGLPVRRPLGLQLLDDRVHGGPVTMACRHGYAFAREPGDGLRSGKPACTSCALISSGDWCRACTTTGTRTLC